MATNRAARLRRLEEAITPSGLIFTIIERDILARSSTVEVEEKRLRDKEGLTDRDLLVVVTCLNPPSGDHERNPNATTGPVV